LRTIKKALSVAVFSAFFCTLAAADTYTVGEHEAVIGALHGIKSRAEYSLVDVARHFDLGFNEITAANRQLNVWQPGDNNVVLIPARFILPRPPYSGLVLNLAEMRLYFYRPASQTGKREVVTHPVGIGRESWETPTLTTTVSAKKAQPSWFVPESIRIEYLAKGKQLPAVVKPGPNNPLGQYALRLGETRYLIHGTNRPAGIGLRVSHGCIRLYPEDIEALFAQVAVGTEVRIVDEPLKAGFLAGQLFLEVHPPYAERVTQARMLELATKMVAETALGKTVFVNWQRVRDVVRDANGIPTAIGATGALDGRRSWMLVAGSFDSESKALSLAELIGAEQLDSRTWKIADRYQVEVGPFVDVQQADYARKLIRHHTGILALKIPPD